MNYIYEINAFNDWCEQHYLPMESQFLWYKLMAKNNRLGWCEWMSVDNYELMSILKIKREATAVVIRNKLVEAGLIEFVKGKKGCPNKYRMISLSNVKVNTEVKSVVYTEVKSVVNSEVYTADINKQNKTKYKQNKTEYADAYSMRDASETPYQAIVDLYNSICVSMPRVDLLTDKRKKTIKSRYGNFNHDLGKFEILFTKAQESDFLSGRIRDFKASFDWLLAPTNYPKVLEGNYDNRSQEAKGYVYGGEYGGDKDGISL